MRQRILDFRLTENPHPRTALFPWHHPFATVIWPETARIGGSEQHEGTRARMLLWLSIGWVFASALVAMLPMRWQYVPGVALLLAAPVLIGLIAQSVGLWSAFAAVLAFGSMFRNPLRYFYRRLTGQVVELPR